MPDVEPAPPPSEGDRLVAVGAVEARSARLWLRTDAPGVHEIHVRGEAGGAGERVVEVDVPTDPALDNTAVAVVAELEPGTDYEYTVRRAADEQRPEATIGAGAFRTAPEPGTRTDDRLSIAVMSCHQPFGDDGEVRDDAAAMLRAAVETLREHRVGLVLMVGDQMYADAPLSRSLHDDDYFASVSRSSARRLLDCDAAEVRRLYQERYRRFWAIPEWQQILANYPCYPAIDDHEIVDNWGSDPAHDTEEWAAVRDGARAAYFDYQGARVLEGGPASVPRSFHYRFDHGDVAVFVTDLRSSRSISQRTLLGDEQRHAVADFLDDCRDREIALLVTSQPLFHVPEIAARIGAVCTSDGDDFSDRLVHPAFDEEFDALCEMLREHRRRAPEQQFVLVSGDIHVGAISALRWQDDEPPFWQIVASPLTNNADVLSTRLSKLAVQAAHAVPESAARPAPQLSLAGDADALNPYTDLHVGLVTIERDTSSGAPLIELSLVGQEDGRPKTAVRSR